MNSQLSVPFDGDSREGPRLDITVINERFNEYPSTTTVIQTGDFLERYDYPKPITIGRKYKRKKNKEIKKEEKNNRSEEYKRRKAQRVIGKVSRIVQGNFSKKSKFLTLTFGDNDFDINDLKETNKKFHLFITKLRNHYPELKYLAVPEFQERGAVHYHIAYNLPFIKKETLRKIWGLGYIKIKKIYRVYGIGCYFTKYLSKNCQDDRLFNHRAYFCSRNLIKPKIFYGVPARELIESLSNNLTQVYENKYQTQFYGEANYKKYHLDSKIKKNI